MKPKAQFGPLIRTDIGIGPFADISVKDQVRDQMIHRYDMYLEAPISETSIHRIRYRIRSISDYLDPISVQEKKCGGGRPGRFRTQWTKSILWGNGWSSTRPSDIGDDSGTVAPVAANRFGKRSAPECRGAFCMPCSGTDTEHTGKAIRTDIRTRNKAKRKASQKRTHRKRSHTQPKANQKNKQSNNRQKTSIPTTKAENQKLYLPKRNHGRLAPGFTADAWERRNTAILWVK